MRRLLHLSCLIIVIAILSGSLLLLRRPVETPTQTVTPLESTYRMLYTRSQQDFAAMRITLASGESYVVESSLAYDANGKLLGVYNSLGQPVVIQGQEDFALDSAAYQMMLLTAVNLPVTASYDGLDLQSCGLATPAARIEITYHSTEPIVLTVGRETASGNSCYVQMAGDDSIHLVPVDFFQVMTRHLKAHHRLPWAITKAVASAVQIAIVRPGEKNFIAANYGTSGRILPWQIDAPYTHAGSTERITAFVQTVADIHADAYVTTLQNAEELATYGLDDPTRLLVAYSDGTIRDIHLGHDAGDGTVYARMDSTADVYQISTAQLPKVEGNATDALLDRFIALLSTNEVADLLITAGEKTWQLTIHTQGESNRYAINEHEVDTETFSGAYKAVAGIEFDKTAPASSTGKPLCETRFLLADGTTTRVTYHEYDQHYVQAETSGGGIFLLRRERLETMLTALQEATP